MNNLSKKKKRTHDMDIEEEEDYNMYYDQDNKHLNTNELEEGKFDDELINVDFLFSEIRETYYFGIKGFLEGLLNFDEFNSGELADMILAEKDFIGTVIKTELEEETGNQMPDLYALATLVPFNFFPDSVALKQIVNFLIRNINSSLNSGRIDKKQAEEVSYLLGESFKKESKFKLGLFINERASNLPLQLIGPLFNLVREDIVNYKDANDNNPKYDFTHIVYITKFVKKQPDMKKTNKKSNVEKKEEDLYYKFDDEFLIKEADFYTYLKVPFLEKQLENIENKNEPVYKGIVVIRADKFNLIIDKLLNIEY